MKKMRFDVKCVRECLIKNKVVFTVRRWKSYNVKEFINVDGVGVCVKERVREVHGIQDIKEFVGLSGFERVEDWWEKVKMFGACDGWLYRVELHNILHETKDDFVLYEDVKTRWHGARLATTRKVIELVKLPHKKFTEKTIGVMDALKPLVCREFCEKSKSCKLIENGFGDLCKHHDRHGILVKRVPPKPSHEPRPKVRWIKSAARSIWLDDYESNWKTDANGSYIKYTDPRMVPEAELAVPGIDQKPAAWEDYSAAPFQDTFSDIPCWDEPEEGFGVITRKQRANMRAKVEEKRRGRFMMRHGLRLKDKLNDLMFRSPEKAREIAAKLTFEDWKAIDMAGGLCVNKGVWRRIYR